jgi:hypothetical protein
MKRIVFGLIVFGYTLAVIAADQQLAAAPDGPVGSKLSERLGPYDQTAPFRVGEDEKREAWKKEFDRLTLDEKVRYCVFQLRNESWFDGDVFFLRGDTLYSKEPEWTPRQELVKLGRSAMPQLLRALDSRVNTQIHSTRWATWEERHWLVQDAALDVIEHIACRSFGEFSGGGTSVPKLTDVEQMKEQKIRSEVAAWWEQNKGSDEVQWATQALLSGSTALGGGRSMAIESLYRRLGKASYPLLAKAYHHLPKGREGAEHFDETYNIKTQILWRLLKSPATSEKSVFASAVHDAPLWVRIDGAKGLWALGDPSGLEAMAKETEDRLLKGAGSEWLNCEYDNLMSFLWRCNTPTSREAIYECLRGQNPYLRDRAIRDVPSLRMEKAVRALPELFDDQFVLRLPYIPGSTGYVRKVETTVPPKRAYEVPAGAPTKAAPDVPPPTRVCDEAAEAFTKVVPDAPRFLSSTAAEQQGSIEKLKQWWKENRANLKWDEKRGVLVRPAKE